MSVMKETAGTSITTVAYMVATLHAGFHCKEISVTDGSICTRGLDLRCLGGNRTWKSRSSCPFEIVRKELTSASMSMKRSISHDD